MMEIEQWSKDHIRPVGYRKRCSLAQARREVAEWFAPKADAAMAEDGYEISLELPGVAATDIDVMVQEGSLTIQGEKHLDHEGMGRAYFFSEREYGAFQRSFRLPRDAASDRIDAAFKNGVLSAKIPKLLPAAGDSRKVQGRTG